MQVRLYEDIARTGRITTSYDYPVMVNDRYVMAPTPKFDNPKMDMSPALQLFGAGREKRIYAIAELGPWWRAAQLFIRWSRLGAWQQLLEAAQARGVELGMAFLDGTSIRAHPKAAGAPKKGGPRANGTAARRSAARAAGSAPRPA